MSDKIYKYVDLKCGLLILKNNSVKASHPNDYNDPFDCSIDYNDEDILNSMTLITEYYMIQEFFKLCDRPDLKVNKITRLSMNNDRMLLNACLKISKKMKYFDHIMGLKFLSKKLLLDVGKYSEETYDSLESKFKNDIMNKVIEMKNDSLLSCFSKNYDSILMWSHYADKHKGICIEFDRPNKDFYDVYYSKNRTHFNLEEVTKRALGYLLAIGNVDASDEQLMNHIMEPFKTKSLAWIYEEEVRCVLSTKSDGISYDKGKDIYLYEMPTKITKIFIGCKVDKASNEYKELLELCKDKIEIVELSQSDKEYKLI